MWSDRRLFLGKTLTRRDLLERYAFPGRNRSRRSRWVAIPVGLFAASALGECLGAVDRSDFNQLLVRRGGGLVSSLPQEAIASLRARLRVSDFSVVRVSLSAPGQNADFLVLQPDRPDFEDSYSYAQGRLSSPRPVRVSAESSRSSAFPISQLTALARVEEIVDTALAKTGFEDGHVSAIAASLAGGVVRVSAQVEFPRSAATVFFDQAGTFIKVELQ